jgi:hypothetical protein
MNINVHWMNMRRYNVHPFLYLKSYVYGINERYVRWLGAKFFREVIFFVRPWKWVDFPGFGLTEVNVLATLGNVSG